MYVPRPNGPVERERPRGVVDVADDRAGRSPALARTVPAAVAVTVPLIVRPGNVTGGTVIVSAVVFHRVSACLVDAASATPAGAELT